MKDFFLLIQAMRANSSTVVRKRNGKKTVRRTTILPTLLSGIILGIALFFQRFQDKHPLVHLFMRNCKFSLIYNPVIIHKDVYVYHTVMVLPSDRLLNAPHSSLYCLRSHKHFARCKPCLHTYGSIDKHVVRRKAPRLGIIQR